MRPRDSIARSSSAVLSFPKLYTVTDVEDSYDTGLGRAIQACDFRNIASCIQVVLLHFWRVAEVWHLQRGFEAQ